MNEAIRLVVEKGGLKEGENWKFVSANRYWVVWLNGNGDETTISTNNYLLDQLFWQALGRALGNKEEMRCDSPHCDNKLCEYAGYKDPHVMFMNFMEHIWNGKNPDEFFRELIK